MFEKYSNAKSYFHEELKIRQRSWSYLVFQSIFLSQPSSYLVFQSIFLSQPSL